MAARAEAPVRLSIVPGDMTLAVAMCHTAFVAQLQQASWKEALEPSRKSDASALLVTLLATTQLAESSVVQQELHLQEVAVLSVFDMLPNGGRRLLGQLFVAAAALQALQGVCGCFQVIGAFVSRRP